MTTTACQFFYECESCKTTLRPKAGDCCVFCSIRDGEVPADAVPWLLWVKEVMASARCFAREEQPLSRAQTGAGLLKLDW
jgi:hypothetical protein